MSKNGKKVKQKPITAPKVKTDAVVVSPFAHSPEKENFISRWNRRKSWHTNTASRFSGTLTDGG